jgi:hypothetical protein
MRLIIVFMYRNGNKNMGRMSDTITIRSRIRVYKILQILMSSWNGFNRKCVLPCILQAATIVCIISLYVCLVMSGEIPLPGFLLFPLLLVNCVCFIIFICTKASSVNISSIAFIAQERSRLAKFNKNALLRKVVKSIPPLKVEFASNYIDKLTPLVLLNFCINQTVSLLIIKNRY